MRSPRNIRLLIRKISELNRQRTDNIFHLVHGKDMVCGSCHEVFRRCGKKNCRCADGKLHGPYSALSVSKNGRKKIIMVRKRDAARINKEAKRYRYFQNKLADIRKINNKIDRLLNEIKTATVRNYP